MTMQQQAFETASPAVWIAVLTKIEWRKRVHSVMTCGTVAERRRLFWDWYGTLWTSWDTKRLCEDVMRALVAEEGPRRWRGRTDVADVACFERTEHANDSANLRWSKKMTAKADHALECRQCGMQCADGYGCVLCVEFFCEECNAGHVHADMTLGQIGDVFGLSRERVRSIIEEALGKLRNPRIGVRNARGGGRDLLPIEVDLIRDIVRPPSFNTKAEDEAAAARRAERDRLDALAYEEERRAEALRRSSALEVIREDAEARRRAAFAQRRAERAAVAGEAQKAINRAMLGRLQ